jgi:Zn-finger nucleic acid-binding protein
MFRDRSMRCPRCAVDLAQIGVRDKWRCTGCGGIWLGPAELADELGDHAGAFASAGVPELGCPACQTELDHGTLLAVRIDRCASCHHVWLDAGELGGLRAALPARAIELPKREK